MVDGEGALEAVRGDVPRVPVAPGVVDQHIVPGQPPECFSRQPSYLDLGGQVAHEDVHPLTTGGLDLAGRVLGTALVTADDRDVRPQVRQTHGGRPADAPGAPGDEHRASGHRSVVDLL